MVNENTQFHEEIVKCQRMTASTIVSTPLGGPLRCRGIVCGIVRSSAGRMNCRCGKPCGNPAVGRRAVPPTRMRLSPRCVVEPPAAERRPRPCFRAPDKTACVASKNSFRPGFRYELLGSRLPNLSHVWASWSGLEDACAVSVGILNRTDSAADTYPRGVKLRPCQLAPKRYQLIRYPRFLSDRR